MKTYSLDYTKINARYNIDQVLKEAFDYGKNLNLYEKYKLIKKPVNKEYSLKFGYDTKPVEQLISNIKKEIDKASAEGRSTNITLATKSINGTLIMPGQNFSFNGKVGQITPAKGYQPAPVDIGTKAGTDYGSGICQVSTSLYNAVIRANIKSTERNHL